MRLTARTDDPGTAAASPQDAVNAPVYRSPDVTRIYTDEGLDAQETTALLRYRDAFKGRSMLDIGVGTGRTTRVLARIAGRYVGIDSSPVMIDHVRRVLPHVEVHLNDMRNLSHWDAASFDFVFGSNNVVDAVSHEDRLATLREIRRVLRPDGTLMFTTHNRRYRRAEAGPQFVPSRNPLAMALGAFNYARSLMNYARVKPLRRFEPGYALLNDRAHDFKLLHYYVDRTTQERQLTDLGFDTIDVMDKSGESLAPGDNGEGSSFLMYVARPSGAPAH